MCISCFREIGLSKRTHCLDIETAYSTVQNAMCKSIEYTCTTQSSLSDLVDKIDLMITETKDSSQKVSRVFFFSSLVLHVFHVDMRSQFDYIVNLTEVRLDKEIEVRICTNMGC